MSFWEIVTITNNNNYNPARPTFLDGQMK